ncbi:MAG: 3-deoxy-7-phosphoheptulonate synthase [Planctomycetes bacterium]|nr:3-deoxy-7-phosphoheptulonate synthase [Planctomycetota bacterium]
MLTNPRRPATQTPPATDDLNVASTRRLFRPHEAKQEIPLGPVSQRTVVESRAAIRRILRGDDRRLLVIVGPCSIHDEAAALEYAERLNQLRLELEDHLCLVMRVYFEKPRTTTGWKGLINDPRLDDTFDMEAGIRAARRILQHITELGLAAGTEMLDPITPQYIADLVSWAAIGARTTESQTHRQMASGLSMPVGFKNGTDGRLQAALDALDAARHPHSFLGIDQQGRTAVIRTRGNAWGHLILRGGRAGPNYAPEMTAEATEALQQSGLAPALMVDCSHANSGKCCRNQAVVWRSILEQRQMGHASLIGAMLESNLHEGNQKLGDNPAELRYGVSITDECIGWDETEQLLRETHGRRRCVA